MVFVSGKKSKIMGSECSLPWDSESRSPSPTYGRYSCIRIELNIYNIIIIYIHMYNIHCIFRNAVVMKRAPSITSAEMRAEVMKAEVEQVGNKKKHNCIIYSKNP